MSRTILLSAKCALPQEFPHRPRAWSVEDSTRHLEISADFPRHLRTPADPWRQSKNHRDFLRLFRSPGDFRRLLWTPGQPRRSPSSPLIQWEQKPQVPDPSVRPTAKGAARPRGCPAGPSLELWPARTPQQLTQRRGALESHSPPVDGGCHYAHTRNRRWDGAPRQADRRTRWTFPSPATASSAGGSSSEADRWTSYRRPRW